MSGTFKEFMNGESRRPRINWYDVAMVESKALFNKKYEELTPEELKYLLKVLTGEIEYW